MRIAKFPHYRWLIKRDDKIHFGLGIVVCFSFGFGISFDVWTDDFQPWFRFDDIIVGFIVGVLVIRAGLREIDTSIKQLI